MTERKLGKGGTGQSRLASLSLSPSLSLETHLFLCDDFAVCTPPALKSVTSHLPVFGTLV